MAHQHRKVIQSHCAVVVDVLAEVGFKHVVITSVDRDDLPDGGAEIWAETIREVHAACPEMSVEVLLGDFKGVEAALWFGRVTTLKNRRKNSAPSAQMCTNARSV